MHRPLLTEERLLPSALGSGLQPMHLSDAMELLGERVGAHLETSREYEVFDLAFS